LIEGLFIFSDLPPPGFSKISKSGPAGKQAPVESQESSSIRNSENAWVEKSSKSDSPPAITADEDVLYSSNVNAEVCFKLTFILEHLILLIIVSAIYT
jgi:hypothetical protein